jgi:hypothetical protein
VIIPIKNEGKIGPADRLPGLAIGIQFHLFRVAAVDQHCPALNAQGPPGFGGAAKVAGK